ncbi:MAG TPA: OB-fold nucleic acid binding domain-containing protein [Terriglobales bacterium]|nr:OB-fold nucleic acid binding domain-containing protein [Terriglobales bacterium]
MSEPLKPCFVAELVADSTITSVFLVHRKDLRQKKDGDNYLSLTLGDRTGQIDANMWDRVAEVQNSFERDDFIRVRGVVKLYREKPQLTIERLRRVEERDVQLADYLPATTADVGAMFAELLERVASVQNPHLRALLQAIFQDPDIARRYQIAPAAKALHHAYLGGLLEHVTSLCRLGELVLRNYPFVDRDLLLTGILLHDLGKIEELSYQRSFAYTTSGQLLGHMVIVLELLHRKLAALPDFPHALQTLVEHLIISHHGQYAFGSPKLPMFPEALLLHQLDDMDSKMQAMHTQLQQEAPTNAEWTAFNRSLERPLLRTERWLAAGAGRADAGAAANTESANPLPGLGQ